MARHRCLRVFTSCLGLTRSVCVFGGHISVSKSMCGADCFAEQCV